MHTRPRFTRAAAAALLAVAAAVASAAPLAPAEQQALAALRTAYAQAVVPGAEADRHAGLFGDLLARVRQRSASPVELATVMAAATATLAALPAGVGEPAATFRRALHAALQPVDPHFRYIEPRTWDAERGDSLGSFGGLGLEVESSGDAIRVVAPMPGGPGERAGLAVGDRIVRIDDLPVAGGSLADAIARMRGTPGTAVSLVVRKAGGAGDASETTLQIVRERIRRQLLAARVDGDTLVVRLAAFGGDVSEALEKAVAAAEAAERPRAIVLDLRGNPGGLLREAVKVADAFLPAGDIVSLRNPAGEPFRTWQADARELLAGVPMVVLVDGRSASASELVADALQHHGRAAVLGGRSFGKGSVQTTSPLGEGNGAIRLTTALYHGPSGRTVHRVGVVPDIELARDGPAAAAAAPAPGAAEPRRPAARVDPARCSAAPAPDPVLACALAYLRAGDAEAFLARLAVDPA